MIFNTVLNGSWWFYPSPLDFVSMVIMTLFIEVIIIWVFCCLVDMKRNKISMILGGVIIANMVSAIIGYIILFPNFGGW